MLEREYAAHCLSQDAMRSSRVSVQMRRSRSEPIDPTDGRGCRRRHRDRGRRRIGPESAVRALGNGSIARRIRVEALGRRQRNIEPLDEAAQEGSQARGRQAPKDEHAAGSPALDCVHVALKRGSPPLEAAHLEESGNWELIGFLHGHSWRRPRWGRGASFPAKRRCARQSAAAKLALGPRPAPNLSQHPFPYLIVIV